MFVHVNSYYLVATSQADYSTMMPFQFDDTDDGNNTTHLKGGGVKPRERPREERHGKIQIKRQAKKGIEPEISSKEYYYFYFSGVWDVWHQRPY